MHKRASRVPTYLSRLPTLMWVEIQSNQLLTEVASSRICLMTANPGHLALFQEGKKWKARLSVPGDEVKNGVDIVGELTPLTVQILRRWLDNFRPAGCAIDCSWLFPARSGGHLAGTHAYQDVRDLALRHLGLDITPHLIRSFIGKAMLDERPDSHADIQQILGHRQIKTTISFYAPVSPAQARRRYHESLGQLRGRS